MDSAPGMVMANVSNRCSISCLAILTPIECNAALVIPSSSQALGGERGQVELSRRKCLVPGTRQPEVNLTPLLDEGRQALQARDDLVVLHRGDPPAQVGDGLVE